MLQAAFVVVLLLNCDPTLKSFTTIANTWGRERQSIHQSINQSINQSLQKKIENNRSLSSTLGTRNLENREIDTTFVQRRLLQQLWNAEGLVAVEEEQEEAKEEEEEDGAVWKNFGEGCLRALELCLCDDDEDDDDGVLEL